MMKLLLEINECASTIQTKIESTVIGVAIKEVHMYSGGNVSSM